jgi:hypothetical protein
MTPVMYSHRLKNVLQHTVRELGLTVSLTDENTPVSLADNEAMIRETPPCCAFNSRSSMAKATHT